MAQLVFGTAAVTAGWLTDHTLLCDGRGHGFDPDAAGDCPRCGEALSHPLPGHLRYEREAN